MIMEATDKNGQKQQILLPSPERMLESIADQKRTMEHLRLVTNLARQWERFNGQPDSTTDEIEAAEDFLEASGD